MLHDVAGLSAKAACIRHLLYNKKALVVGPVERRGVRVALYLAGWTSTLRILRLRGLDRDYR